MKILDLPAILAVAACCAGLAFAEPSGEKTASNPREMNILWLGSSSTPPQLMEFVKRMLETDGSVKVGVNKKVAGYFNTAFLVTEGEGLKHNVGNGKSLGEVSAELEKELKAAKIDFVVVQVRHHTARFPDLAAKAPEYIKKLCEVIRAGGAQPVFYVAPGEKNKKKQEALTNLVSQFAKENKAPVAWGTEALLEVIDLKGADYVKNAKAGDAGHVGPFGNFTYASSLYQALTGKSPVGHPLRDITTTSWKVRFGDDIPEDSPMYTTIIPDEDAAFIQKTVAAVQERLGGGGNPR